MNTFLALKLVHLKPFERLLYNVFITVNLQFLIFAKEVESGCVPKYSGPRLMMDRYLAGPQISWNPLSLSSAFIQFDSLCGCGDQGRGHQDTRRLGYLTSATQKISRVAENIPTEHRTDAAAGSRLGTPSLGRGGGSSGCWCSPWLGSSSRSHWRSYFYIRRASDENHL